MRNLSVGALFILLVPHVAVPLHAQSTSNQDSFAMLLEAYGNTLPYRLFVPVDPEPGRAYPPVLFLHGAGERGIDDFLQISAPIGPLLDTMQDSRFPAYLLAPQVPADDRWNSSRSIQLVRSRLDEVQHHYQVDRQLWVFHGAGDSTVSVELSRLIVQALRDLGAEPHYTEYPALGHDTWWLSCSDPDDGLYPWMFGQALPHPLPPVDWQIPRAAFTLTAAGIPEPVNVTVDGTSSETKAGTIVSCHWNFGDGTTAEGPVASHAYDGVTPTRVTLTAADSSKKSSTLASRSEAFFRTASVDPWTSAEVGDVRSPGGARLEDDEPSCDDPGSCG